MIKTSGRDTPEQKASVSSEGISPEKWENCISTEPIYPCEKKERKSYIPEVERAALGARSNLGPNNKAILQKKG